MDSYLKEDATQSVQRKITHATHLLIQIDCRISNALFRGSEANEQVHAEMMENADVLEKYLRTEIASALSSSKPTPEDLFALGMLKLRIQNLSYNMGNSPIPDAKNAMWPYT